MIDGYNTLYSECEAVLWPHLWAMSDLTFLFTLLCFPEDPKQSRISWFWKSFGLIWFFLPGSARQQRGPWVNHVMSLKQRSTLGGKIILKTLREQRRINERSPFLDPYGKDAGALWRVFLSVLERETAPDRTAMNECVGRDERIWFCGSLP